MQGYQAHATRTVSGKTLHGHISHDITSVFDIRCLTERRIGSTHIMMIAAQHDRSYFSPPYHFIETEGDIHSSYGILIENTCLSTYYQPVLFGVAYPVIIIQILSPSIDINALHCGTVRFYQIFVPTAQTYPSEGAIAIIKELGSHDIFYITRPYKSVFLINSIAGNLFHSGIINRFHKGVAIIEEVSAACHQFPDYLKMAAQRSVCQTTELIRRFMKKAGALFESQAYGTVASFVNGMTRGLIGQKFNMNLLTFRIFQQIDDVAMIGYRARFPTFHRFFCQTESLRQVLCDMAYPSLPITCFDTGAIDFGYNRGCSGYFGCLWLCPAHSSQTGRYEEVTTQIFVLRNAEFQSSGIE